MLRKVLLVSFILVIAVVSASYAQTSCAVCDKAASSNANWPERSLHQSLQGVTNATLGWTEVFVQPLRENTDDPSPDPAYKSGNGLLKGWGQAVIMTGAGLLELVTFWTPVRIIPNTTCVGCRDLGRDFGVQPIEPIFAAADMLGGAGKTIATDASEIVPGAQQAISEAFPKR